MRRRHAETAEKRGERDFPGLLPVGRLRAGDVLRAVDLVEPDRLRQIRLEDRRAVGPVQRAEAGEERRDPVVARGLELLDVDRERVAGDGALDVEGAGLGILVSRGLDLGRELPGLRHGAVVAVLGPRDDARSRRDAAHRRMTAEGVLELLVRRHVAEHRALLRRRGRLAIPAAAQRIAAPAENRIAYLRGFH